MDRSLSRYRGALGEGADGGTVVTPGAGTAPVSPGGAGTGGRPGAGARSGAGSRSGVEASYPGTGACRADAAALSVTGSGAGIGVTLERRGSLATCGTAEYRSRTWSACRAITLPSFSSTVTLTPSTNTTRPGAHRQRSNPCNLSTAGTYTGSPGFRYRSRAFRSRYVF